MTWISLLMCVHRCGCGCVCMCVWMCACNLMLRTACECCGMLRLESSGSKIKESRDIRGLETMPVPLGKTAWKCYMVYISKCKVAVTLTIRSNSMALDRCVFTSMMEWWLDINPPKVDSPSPQSQILMELVWLASSTMEREGDGIRGATPDGVQVAFVSLHKWTWWMQTNICNSYTFGDELKYVCQPWDDVSGVILCVPVSQKNTYTPVALEVNVVGMKNGL